MAAKRGRTVETTNAPTLAEIRARDAEWRIAFLPTNPPKLEPENIAPANPNVRPQPVELAVADRRELLRRIDVAIAEIRALGEAFVVTNYMRSAKACEDIVQELER
jgi:hypothetical protein